MRQIKEAFRNLFDDDVAKVKLSDYTCSVKKWHLTDGCCDDVRVWEKKEKKERKRVHTLPLDGHDRGN